MGHVTIIRLPTHSDHAMYSFYALLMSDTLATLVSLDSSSCQFSFALISHVRPR